MGIFQPTMKLNLKVTLALLLVSLLPLGFFGMLALHQASRDISGFIQQYLLVNTTRTSTQVHMLLDRFTERVRLVASPTQLRVSLEHFIRTADEVDRARMIDMLDDTRGSIASFESISIAGRSGLVVASTDPELQGVDLSDDPLFSDAHEGVAVEGLRVEGGEVKCRFMGPVNLDDRHIGFVMIQANTVEFARLLGSPSGLGDTGELFLVLPGQPGEGVLLAPGKGYPGGLVVHGKVLDAGGNSASRDGDQLSMWESVKGTQWRVFCRVDAKEAREPLTQAAGRLLQALGLTGVAVMILAGITSRRLTGPIVALARAAEDVVRRGSYERRLEIGSADELGELTGSFNTMLQVIADRTRAYQDQSERIRAILESAGDGILTFDGRGRLESMNPSAAQMFGFETAGRCPEVSVTTLFPGLDLKSLVHFEDSQGLEGEMEGVTLQGLRLPCEGTLSRVNLEDRILFSLVIRDVTDRRAAEARMLSMNRELQRSNEELEHFAYVASHDLKSPLRAIDNLATWIEEDSGEHLSEESRNDLKTLRSRVSRMQRLLDDLLEYSKVGRVKEVPSRVDIAEVIRDVVDLLKLGSEFRVEMENVMPSIEVARGAIYRIFGNLISNAVKHHDRKDGWVGIRYAAEAGHHVFWIRDDGPGIDPQFHERIFKMFQTLKRRDEVEGSGMGLALVRKTVHHLGGSVALESCLGGGTTFILRWPMGLMPELPAPDR